MIRIIPIHLLSMIFFLLAFPGPAAAEEAIEHYKSVIEVLGDGDILVHETIKARAEGIEIRRGIYRDLPRYRRTAFGGVIPLNIGIESVRRDGRTEPYHIERIGNTLRIYIGEADVFLTENKSYTYELSYRVSNQVFFFADFDELNWNAIGTGWIFPIHHAEAVIYAPEGANILNHAAYTGKALSGDGDYESRQEGRKLSVTAKNTLFPGEGMTVAVSWPKGFVTPDPAQTGLRFFLLQHRGSIFLLIAGIVTALYYHWAWGKFGRDPRRRRLAPFYDAPENISPAMAAYIHTMGDADSDRCVTAAIVSLAAKGHITIEDKGGGKYILSPVKNGRSSLSEDEKIIASKITSPITVGSSSAAWEAVAEKHHDCLEQLCHGPYFIANTWWWAAGAIPLFTATIILYLAGILPMGFLIACGALLLVGEIARQLVSGSGHMRKKFLVCIFDGVVFLVSLFGLFLFFGSVSWIVIVLAMSIISGILVMHPLMKRPTKNGIGIMEHIDGLKYYMSAVEEKILKKFDPPEMSRELYEKFLPYAVALRVESQWAEKLALAMAVTMTADEAIASTRPHWYSGSGGGTSFSTTGMVSSFSSAISATMSSPSSSGGGGSVGGGGGGGGGGGW